MKQRLYKWASVLGLSGPEGPEARKAYIVLVASAVLLTLFYYYGGRGAFYNLGVGQWAADTFRLASQEAVDLVSYAWWGGGQLVFRVFAPVLIILFLLKGRLGDYGFRLSVPWKHWRIYFLMYAAVFPLLLAASFQPAFQATYPFYKPALEGGGVFWTYEAVYLFQFIGVEAFFRGFMTFGLARAIGPLAVPIMTIPYAMIHFGKPAGEAFGAIIAGLVLGALALKSRSFVPGLALHWGVAVTMDLMVLAHHHGGVIAALMVLF